MADDGLRDMLLAAAGRSSKNDSNMNSHGKKRAPAARESSSSSDEYEDDDEVKDRGAASASGSKMPLKKRFDSGDKEDGYESDLSFGSDLYRDEDDKRKLLAMTELAREMELHSRAEKRDNYKMRKAAEAKINAKEQQQQHRGGTASSSRVRSSGRETSSKKANALNELVAKRQKAQDMSDQQRKRRDMAAAAAAAPSRRRSASPSSNSDAESDDEESSRGESNRSEPLPDDDDDDVRGTREFPDNEDIKKITVRRSRLFKWFMEPFFEKVIVGCFVRIGIGVTNTGNSIYRVCFVKNVDARDTDKQYKFENRMTFKYLNCTWGDDTTAARWQMVRASDGVPTDEEIDEWKREMTKCGAPALTKTQVQKKIEELQETGTYVYSAAAVKQMLQEKKATAKPSSTVIQEKERLVKDLKAAEAKGNREQVDRIHEKLKELESSALSKQQTKNEKAERIEMMNRRNRFENFKNASELKPVTGAKMGEAGYDPFSRRWTRSQNYHMSETPKAGAEQSEVSLADKSAKELDDLNDPSVKAKSRLGAEQQYSKFHLHNFDLPISLAPLERFKGPQGAAAAFMERKRKIEERYGVRVENNDEHPKHTLTVNDYKRRRGLL